MIKIICLIILGLCGLVITISTFISFCKIEKNHREMEKIRRDVFSAHGDQKRRENEKTN